jgi:hypothetical protein
MMSIENRTSSHAIQNPEESHIFGVNTADLPFQAVPSWSRSRDPRAGTPCKVVKSTGQMLPSSYHLYDENQENAV